MEENCCLCGEEEEEKECNIYSDIFYYEKLEPKLEPTISNGSFQLLFIYLFIFEKGNQPDTFSSS